MKSCTLEEGETTAVVPEGVKAIGEKGGFTSKPTWVSITLPRSLTRIEREAFYYCKNLESVVIRRA